MPDNQRRAEQTTSYAAVLRRVAKRHDFEIEKGTVIGQILHKDAAALRALAALIEKIEAGNSDDTDYEAICNLIAAGFPTIQPPEEGR